MGIALGSGKSQPLRALCFSLLRYRRNQLPLLCSKSGAAPAAAPAACGPASGRCSAHACVLRQSAHRHFPLAFLTFDSRLGGIKRVQAWCWYYHPRFEVNLSHCARFAFSLALSTKPTTAVPFILQPRRLRVFYFWVWFPCHM